MTHQDAVATLDRYLTDHAIATIEGRNALSARLIEEVDWDGLCLASIEQLRRGGTENQMAFLASVFLEARFWYNKAVPVDVVTPLLLRRIPKTSTHYNMVWTLFTDAFDVPYNSDFDPLSHPSIKEQMLGL